MTDSRDGWLDDLAEASARITQLEATIENLSFQANSLIKRGSSLASENAALREDRDRLHHIDLFCDVISFDTDRHELYAVGDLRGVVDRDMAKRKADLEERIHAIDAARSGE